MRPEHSASPADDRYLTKKGVKRRYDDCSDMWIHRRLNDGSGFPKPIHVAGRPYWSIAELCAWERSLASKKQEAQL